MNLQSDGTEFDVRAIPCRIKHGHIFQRWLELPVGKHFVLVNDHDPIPLRYQFDAEFPGAVGWEYLHRGPDEVRVKITKKEVVVSPTQPRQLPAACSSHASPLGIVQEVDARGLEPPDPFILILGALERLPSGVTLRALTDREPCHLISAARERGFSCESTEQADRSWASILAHG